MYCGGCGTKNPDGERFCSSCGKRLAEGVSANPKDIAASSGITDSRKGRLRVIAGIAGISIALLGLAGLLGVRVLRLPFPSLYDCGENWELYGGPCHPVLVPAINLGFLVIGLGMLIIDVVVGYKRGQAKHICMLLGFIVAIIGSGMMSIQGFAPVYFLMFGVPGALVGFAVGAVIDQFRT